MFRFGSWPVENGTLGKEGMMGEREGRGKSSERGGRERGRSRSGSRSRSRLEGEGSDSRKDRGETQRGRRAEGAHLAFTPTALNSGAQRRAVPCEAFRRSMVAHAGLPSGPMIEPQRGSTMNQSQSKLVIICGTPLGFKFVLHSNPVCAARHSPAFPTNLLLSSEISALVRTSLDSRICRVSTQLHPRLCPKPTPALDLRSFATNFVRNAGWALEWNCFAVL